MIVLLILVLAYLLGSVPFGLVFVRLFTGQDIRTVGSGRTGGTNAMRAGGFHVGLMTAAADMLKGAVAVWLVKLLAAVGWLAPGPSVPWVEIGAALAVILGHNYSAFLKLKGGAGGAPMVGGAMGMWVPSALIIIPVGALVLFGVGYASLATMTVALAASAVFAYRTLTLGPEASAWAYVFYGLAAFVLLAWSLRPNIARLINGTERLVGWRAKRQQAKMGSQAGPSGSAES